MFRVPAKKRMHTTRKQLAGMKRRLAELRLCEAHGGVCNRRFTRCEETDRYCHIFHELGEQLKAKIQDHLKTRFCRHCLQNLQCPYSPIGQAALPLSRRR